MPVEIRTTSVDGIPAVTVADDGPARCALTFRVGTSDETLTTAGVTHTVEHLAMYALGRTAHDSNAFVDATRTVFYAVGEVDEVVAFLRDVSAALSSLPLSRLESERRILLTEAARRGSGGHDELLTFRFGPRTYGIRAYDEYGIRHLQESDIEQWTRTRFTRRNAALWTNVDLPDDLVLDLPDGRRHPPAEPHTVDQLPARVATRYALGLDCIAARSLAVNTAWRLLQLRMQDSLRREHAVVYDIGVDGERVGARSRRLVLLTDPLPEVRYRAGKLLLRTFEQTLEDGFTPAELRVERLNTLRSWSEPGAGLALADSWTHDTLVGERPRDEAELRAELDGLTADDVTEALREAARTALFAVPDEVVTALPLKPAARWSSSWQPGQMFMPSAAIVRAAPARNSRRLFVGDTGITLAASEHEPVSVAFDQCQAVLTWRDGSRRLIGDDGFQAFVAPWEWHEGPSAVDLLDRGTPQHLLVDMGEGEGPPEELAAAPVVEQAPRPRYLLMLLWAALSLGLMAFAVTPVEVSTHEDPGPLAYLGCDRASALEVLRDGPGPRVTGQSGPAATQLIEACRQEAMAEAVLGAAGVISLLACGVVAVRFVQKRRAQAGRSVTAPT